MDEQIKPVAWIVGNVSFGPYDFRKTEPRGWGYSEPLIKLSEHRAAIDALRAEVERLRHDVKQYMDSALAENVRAGRAEAEAEALRAQLRGIQQDALELYEQIPQLPVTIHTLDAATDAFTRFCIDFSEHIDAARKGAE